MVLPPEDIIDKEFNMVGLTNEQKKNLILSVGTGLSERRLTPIEVAEYFEIEKKSGKSAKDIASGVLLSTSMVHEFNKLLNLSDNIKHLINWGHSEITISFSAASVLATLNKEDQQLLIEEALKNSLTKNEIIQIVQLVQRSSKTLPLCINEVLRMRPQIIKRYLFAGIVEDVNVSLLINSTQLERDEVMNEFLISNMLNKQNCKGKLGKEIFTLVGDDKCNDIIKNFETNYESYFNCWLSKHLR